MNESIEKEEIIQIGILVRNIEASTKKRAAFLNRPVPEICTTSGYEKTDAHYEGKPCHGLISQSFFRIKNTEIELIQPIGDTPSIWYDCLQKNGEGIHHIAFKVENMAASIVSQEEKGFPLLQKGEFPGGRYAYLDAQPDLSVILEFLEFDK